MNNNVIPKIIHYCWFGNNEKPDIIKKCIDSWKKYCPDYKIIEWNENNFDISAYDFTKEAYQQKKYAFVSDLARLLIVYENGGIYLDTDVELLAPIDALCNNSAFFVFESERRIASGLGFGAYKNAKSIKAMIDSYNGKHFFIDGKMDTTPCPKINTKALITTHPNLILNGQTQKADDSLFLSPGDYNKIMYHYGTGLWGDFTADSTLGIVNKNTYKDTKLKRFLRSTKSFDFVEKHFNDKIVDFYTFVSYDLLEYGIVHFIKKLFKK